MFCAMASLAVSSALWMTATSAVRSECNLSGNMESSWLRKIAHYLMRAGAAAILALPWVVARLFPPGVGSAGSSGRCAQSPCSVETALRDERITAVPSP